MTGKFEIAVSARRDDLQERIARIDIRLAAGLDAPTLRRLRALYADILAVIDSHSSEGK